MAVSQQSINILTSHFFVLSSLSPFYTAKFFRNISLIVFQQYELQIWVLFMAVAQYAKVLGIHCYIAGSIPVVTPRYCTDKVENAVRSTIKSILFFWIQIKDLDPTLHLVSVAVSQQPKYILTSHFSVLSSLNPIYIAKFFRNISLIDFQQYELQIWVLFMAVAQYAKVLGIHAILRVRFLSSHPDTVQIK